MFTSFVEQFRALAESKRKAKHKGKSRGEVNPEKESEEQERKRKQREAYARNFAARRAAKTKTVKSMSRQLSVAQDRAAAKRARTVATLKANPNIAKPSSKTESSKITVTCPRTGKKMRVPREVAMHMRSRGGRGLGQMIK